MALKLYKPTSPARRHMTMADFAEVTKTKPEKRLTRPLKKSGGRNAHGHITTRHIGGGGSMLKDACVDKLGCFLVGEIDLAVYNAAKEYGMNLLVAGHYATETLGVKALMPVVSSLFDVETVFIDDPKDL